MMLGGGSRISQQLRESNHRHYHHQRRALIGSGLGLCSSRIVQLSSFLAKPSPSLSHRRLRLRHRTVSSSSLQSMSPGEAPILCDSFSLRKEDLELPSAGPSSIAGGIVALGKFDALHIGHRELAIQASKVGVPYLLSFVGMAEVFGWEPRAPIVAKCDRNRVLSSWATYCGNVIPKEFQVEFSSVRHLTPRQFVEKLSKELGVRGVVAGENYRFGYKAAGDATELVRLCKEYGMGVYIINSVMDKHQDPGNIVLTDSKERGQVSSTRVRRALAVGNMKYVSELLGRPHRLMLMLNDQKGSITSSSRWMVSAPKSCLLNLAPKDDIYENCSLLIANETPVRCRVLIDTMHIHLETEAASLCNRNKSQDFQLLGIEFGD